MLEIIYLKQPKEGKRQQKKVENYFLFLDLMFLCPPAELRRFLFDFGLVLNNTDKINFNSILL